MQVVAAGAPPGWQLAAPHHHLRQGQLVVVVAARQSCWARLRRLGGQQERLQTVQGISMG